MTQRVLVAYASKYGGTEAIAERIGEGLRAAGLSADVLPVTQVRDLVPYDAVVLGSAMYVGQWRKEAVAFLERNQAALGAKPLWVFTSGPTGEGDPEELMAGWVLPKKVAPIVERLHARDVAVFGGVLDAERINAIERMMIKQVKAPVGDFRDWPAIDAWAAAIAGALQAGAPG